MGTPSWGTIRMNWPIKIPRRVFSILTLLVAIFVTGAIYLGATGTWAVNAKVVALLGITAHLALVKAREKDIGAQTKWRFWYAAGIGVVAFMWFVGADTGWTRHDDPIRAVSQIILGGYYLFLIFSLPAISSCLLRASGKDAA